MSDLAVIHDKLMNKFNELAVNVLGRLDFEEERVVSNIYLELALMCDLKSLDELTPGQYSSVGFIFRPTFRLPPGFVPTSRSIDNNLHAPALRAWYRPRPSEG